MTIAVLFPVVLDLVTMLGPGNGVREHDSTEIRELI
jgi:hypothetical protein